MKKLFILILLLVANTMYAAELTLLPIEGDGPERLVNAKLFVQGLDKEGRIDPKVTTGISFRFEGKYKIAPANTEIAIFTSKNSENIKDWFNYDSKKLQYSIKQSALKKLLDKVKAAKTATITISLSSSDYDQVDNFSQVLNWRAP